MASLAKGGRLIKNLTPDQVGQALAEWCLVRAGVDLTGRVKVRTDYVFKRGEKLFCSARVEVSVL